ncbi:MAG TPA: chromate efflux transporter [Candidatus Limnocylindrales bacterium]|nr:chromate efflux transporter [Candidatus Limnocylindrales bacterium]
MSESGSDSGSDRASATAGPAGGPATAAEIGAVLGSALRLGLTSFGGPIAHIGYFRREYVERRRWLDDRAFAELLALCQSLPGPASSQLGIAIGTRRAGIAGGVVSWLGFTVPSAILLVLFGLVAGGADVASAGWVHGLKLAAVAVVAQALVILARSLAPDLPRQLVAVAAAAVALAASTPFTQVAIIVAGAAIGWGLLRTAESEDESDAVGAPAIGATGIGATGPIGRRTGLVALTVFFVLLLGLPLLEAATGSRAVAMVETFYRTGSLVFGGGHVVLPLLDAGVVDPGWVSEDRFLAGYGAAQAVPGPLFSFAAYLGSVAASPLGGWPGAAVALGAIYLPSFLLLFGVLPFWDLLRASAGFRRGLTGANAAVVGLLAAALYSPIWTGAIGTWLDVAIAAAGLALLATNRVPPIAVVVGCAVAGQLVAGLAGPS